MAIALVAGLVTLVFTILLTIAGVGAAFILIPVFLTLGIEIHVAMATALLLNSISMAFASWRFVKAELVVWNLAVPILVVAMALAPLGAWVSQGLDPVILKWGFVGFLLFAAAMMLLYRPRARQRERSRSQQIGFGMSVGGVAGFLGGMLGVGGGNFIVPTLVSLGIDPKKAAATTSFVVIFSSFSGFLGHATLGSLSPILLGVTAVASAAGAVIGSYLMTDRLNRKQVKVLIGVVLLGIAAKMVWSLVG